MPSLPASLKGCDFIITLEITSADIDRWDGMSFGYEVLGIPVRSASGMGRINRDLQASFFFRRHRTYVGISDRVWNVWWSRWRIASFFWPFCQRLSSSSSSCSVSDSLFEVYSFSWWPTLWHFVPPCRPSKHQHWAASYVLFLPFPHFSHPWLAHLTTMGQNGGLVLTDKCVVRLLL
jgi:hypothetical protein